MKHFKTIGTAFFLLFFAIPSAQAAPPPRILNHQGRIAISNVNFDGTGYFKASAWNGSRKR